jgi:hypothetical protein
MVTSIGSLTPDQLHSLASTRASHDRRDFGLDDDGSATASEPQDWKVERVEVYDPRQRYPYRVEGINLNCQPEDYGYRFSWRVCSLDNHRYDLSEAVVVRCY